MQIISLDMDKVHKINYKGKTAIIKKSKETEVDSLKLAKEMLQNVTCIINGKKYNLNIPNVYEWNDINQTIIMEYCKGENLELIIRNNSTREYGVKSLHTLLNLILNNNFYWYDFAPRNILISENEITFVDFERGINPNENELQYLRGLVYEEYVAFLLPNERPILNERLFAIDKKDDYKINFDDIKSNRIKALLKKLNLNEKQINYSTYLHMWNLIVSAETPRKNGNTIIYPIVEMERDLADKGYDYYIEDILIRNKINIKEERV